MWIVYLMFLDSRRHLRLARLSQHLDETLRRQTLLQSCVDEFVIHSLNNFD